MSFLSSSLSAELLLLLLLPLLVSTRILALLWSNKSLRWSWNSDSVDSLPSLQTTKTSCTIEALANKVLYLYTHLAASEPSPTGTGTGTNMDLESAGRSDDPPDMREGDCEDFAIFVFVFVFVVVVVVVDDATTVLHGVAFRRIPDDSREELLLPGYMRPGTTTLRSGDLASAGIRTFTSPSMYVECVLIILGGPINSSSLVL